MLNENNIVNFIEKVQDLSKPEIKIINDNIYLVQNGNYKFIEKAINVHEILETKTLTSIISFIENNIGDIEKAINLFIHVVDYDKVLLKTGYNFKNAYEHLVNARCENIALNINNYMSIEYAIIELQTKYIDNDDKADLLQVLASVRADSSIENNDDGVTQEVIMKKGIHTAVKKNFEPIKTLIPRRTFQDVNQPESQFLIRFKEENGIKVALFLADSDAWKQKAMANIETWLINELKAIGKENIPVIA